MTTSIALVTYNRLDLTKRMMESLFKNTDSPFRLIIVDNGSTDGTVDWLKTLYWEDNKYCQSYDIHLFEKNMGIAIGRNQGLKIANQYNDPWLSTVDNDVEFMPGWLTESLTILQALPKFCIGINYEDIKYPMMTKNDVTFQFKKAGNLGTACTVFPRELHKAIGFFITEFGLYGEEDADFFFRARLAGYQMAYLKDNGVHFGQGELDQGPYREFKTASHTANLAKFRQNCHEYVHKKQSIYKSFE